LEGIHRFTDGDLAFVTWFYKTIDVRTFIKISLSFHQGQKNGLVMHRYDILPIIQLADIKIHIIADTDNWSDMYIYQNSTCIDKIVILKG